MAAFLELVASGQVEVEALIDERVPVDAGARRRTNGSWVPSARRSASCSSTSRSGARPARAGSSGDEDVLAPEPSG